jgi:O-antigen/teichoic acid export membrane protein
MRLAARNLSSNYLAYAASILSGLILTPVIIGAIGKEGYGAWAFIISTTTLLRLLDFGIAPTVVRFTAFHRGRAEGEEINAMASAGMAVYVLLGAVSVVVGLIIAWLIPDLIDLSPDLRRPAQVATVLAVLALGTQAPLGLFVSMLKGSQRFDILNASDLISTVVYAVLVVTVFTHLATLPALATIALIVTVIRLGLPAVYVKRELPHLRLSRSLVRRATIRNLLDYSRFAFMTHVAGKVVYSADLILIGAIAGAEPVALYAVATRLFGLAGGVAQTGTDLLLPVQSELEGQADHARQRSVLATGVRGAMCVAVLLSFPLVILPHWIINAWLGSGFEASVVPLALLGIAVSFTQLNAVVAQFLFARGQPRGLAVSQASLAALNLVITGTLLVTVGEIWVAALATVVVEGIGATVVMPALARRRGVSVRSLAVAWGTPLVAGAAAAVPTLILARVLTDTTSLAVLALVGIAWALLFSALAWRFALNASERALVSRLIPLGAGPRSRRADR